MFPVTRGILRLHLYTRFSGTLKYIISSWFVISLSHSYPHDIHMKWIEVVFHLLHLRHKYPDESQIQPEARARHGHDQTLGAES